MDPLTETIHPVQETTRLQDLLPASWRMSTTIVQRPDQLGAISSSPILPWSSSTQVRINFRLWGALAVNQRDLLFLHEVSWRQAARWVQWGTYQGVGLFALGGTLWEIVEGDVAGIALAVLLLAIALKQIDRQHKGTQLLLTADNEALRVAQRRGYTEVMAARSLLEGIQALIKLEGRSGPEFQELVRCQHLRFMAGVSRIEVPTENA